MRHTSVRIDVCSYIHMKQPQHYLGDSWKCAIPSSNPELLNQNLNLIRSQMINVTFTCACKILRIKRMRRENRVQKKIFAKDIWLTLHTLFLIWGFNQMWIKKFPLNFRKFQKSRLEFATLEIIYIAFTLHLQLFT